MPDFFRLLISVLSRGVLLRTRIFSGFVFSFKIRFAIIISNTI